MYKTVYIYVKKKGFFNKNLFTITILNKMIKNEISKKNNKLNSLNIN